MGNYLANDIYPKWSIFMKKILAPLRQKKKKKKNIAQRAHENDVKHAFGVLQAQLAIVCGPTQFFYHVTLQDIMKECIIFHKMIIEDEWDEAKVVEVDYEQIDEISCTPMPHE